MKKSRIMCMLAMLSSIFLMACGTEDKAGAKPHGGDGEKKTEASAQRKGDGADFPEVQEGIADLTEWLLGGPVGELEIWLDGNMLKIDKDDGSTIVPLNFGKKKIYWENMESLPGWHDEVLIRWRRAGNQWYRDVLQVEQQKRAKVDDPREYIQYCYGLLSSEASVGAVREICEYDGKEMIKVTQSEPYAVPPYPSSQIFFQTECRDSGYIPYVSKENDTIYLKKYNIISGVTDNVANVGQYWLSISCLAEGSQGYVFSGSGKRPGVGTQSGGVYGLMDKQGNIKEIVYEYDNKVYAFCGGMMIIEMLESYPRIKEGEIKILSAEDLSVREVKLETDGGLGEASYKAISDYGKYLLEYGRNNEKAVFQVYDTEENKRIYYRELTLEEGWKLNGSKGISETYRGFVHSFTSADGKEKIYYFQF